uniref:Cyclin-dependent kinases regulatory subunit n=1 Tax=Glossina morsitans morsitans TaxID=37546 RepID=A0A1B0G240_GLOMM
NSAVVNISKDIYYSDKYYDEKYEYRDVVLPKELAKPVPKIHLMSEAEWRSIGVHQSQTGTAHITISTSYTTTLNAVSLISKILCSELLRNMSKSFTIVALDWFFRIFLIIFRLKRSVFLRTSNLKFSILKEYIFTMPALLSNCQQPSRAAFQHPHIRHKNTKLKQQ